MIGRSAGQPSRASTTTTVATTSAHRVGHGHGPYQASAYPPTVARVATTRTGQRVEVCCWRWRSSFSHVSGSLRRAASWRNDQFPSSAVTHRNSRVMVRTNPTGAHTRIFTVYFGARTAWKATA